jgi:hypothetical protein
MSIVPHKAHQALYPRRSELVDAFNEFSFLALIGAAQDERARAELIYEFTINALGSEVQRVLPPGWSCAVGGSFIHGGTGRYVAKPVKGKPCEIGDLLVAVEWELDGDSARSALLVQAKRGDHSPAAPWSDASGKNQRALYWSQGKFKWESKTLGWDRPEDERSLAPDVPVDCPCGTSEWTITGDSHWSRWPADGELYGGAVFATLDLAPLAVPPLGGRTPRHLGEVLADLVLFMGGLEFSALEPAYQGHELGWSAVIWDLLRQSADRDHKSWFGPRWSDRTPIRFRDELDLPDADPSSELEDGQGITVLRIGLRGSTGDGHGD